MSQIGNATKVSKKWECNKGFKEMGMERRFNFENYIEDYSFFAMAATFSFFLRALFLTVFRTWWVIRGPRGPRRLRTR